MIQGVARESLRSFKAADNELQLGKDVFGSRNVFVDKANYLRDVSARIVHVGRVLSLLTLRRRMAMP